MLFVVTCSELGLSLVGFAVAAQGFVLRLSGFWFGVFRAEGLGLRLWGFGFRLGLRLRGTYGCLEGCRRFQKVLFGSRLVFKLFGLGLRHFGLGFRENFEERVSAGMVQEHEPMDPP